MLNNPKIQVSITEANQNFSKVAKIVDEEKIVVVLKQNKPKYLIIDFEEFSKMEKNNQEEKTWEEVSKKMLFKNLDAYKELEK
ncbi:Prevent-host-death family protein [Acetoanaerobium sticklandii]|uniref:Antitoxin n=1 Tax=Acetoanaerobium sticklandii (strain ATCC 12662 / DSM 519 / JCM 1433 / CCUG 9281 / NCIMB 10654 / HF) TaxID=499177 RepID=E3PY77_ACESD|nr:type II toxin-antitoxin system Phd/YefM family antitoxin [Acetoanaerobium sticklandii]CBH21392.1 Prevent-host-death family protein [Acetoanaerobium sticklandii]